jgi:hypothetical protein
LRQQAGDWVQLYQFFSLRDAACAEESGNLAIG